MALFFVAVRSPICLLLLLAVLLLPGGPARAQAARPVAFVSLPFDLVGGLVVLRSFVSSGPLEDYAGGVRLPEWGT